MCSEEGGEGEECECGGRWCIEGYNISNNKLTFMSELAKYLQQQPQKDVFRGCEMGTLRAHPHPPPHTLPM